VCAWARLVRVGGRPLCGDVSRPCVISRLPLVWMWVSTVCQGAALCQSVDSAFGYYIEPSHSTRERRNKNLYSFQPLYNRTSPTYINLSVVYPPPLKWVRRFGPDSDMRAREWRARLGQVRACARRVTDRARLGHAPAWRPDSDLSQIRTCAHVRGPDSDLGQIGTCARARARLRLADMRKSNNLPDSD